MCESLMNCKVQIRIMKNNSSIRDIQKGFNQT